jgi:hypothetical protein
MAVDIYFKLEEYPFYDSNEIESINEVENFLQNVEMIITTPKGSVVGDPNFGCSLESYLWTTNKSGLDIKNEINYQINEYVEYDISPAINYDLEVNFIKGEIYDTAIVDLIIDETKVAGYVINT